MVAKGHPDDRTAADPANRRVPPESAGQPVAGPSLDGRPPRRPRGSRTSCRAAADGPRQSAQPHPATPRGPRGLCWGGAGRAVGLRSQCRGPEPRPRRGRHERGGAGPVGPVRRGRRGASIAASPKRLILISAFLCRAAAPFVSAGAVAGWGGPPAAPGGPGHLDSAATMAAAPIEICSRDGPPAGLAATRPLTASVWRGGTTRQNEKEKRRRAVEARQTRGVLSVNDGQAASRRHGRGRG